MDESSRDSNRTSESVGKRVHEAVTSHEGRFRKSRYGRWFSTDATTIVIVAFALRLLATPLTVWGINPYSRADATYFARRAATIGHGFVAGQNLVGPIFPATGVIDIYGFWGLLLSPFWMIPGPSNIYAQVGMAVLGTLIVYNVYAIGRYYGSSLTGSVAALPIAVYPSFVLVQSSLLREAAVLAGITTATHLLIRSPSVLDGRRRTRGVLVVTALVLAAFLRYDNIPVYLLAFGAGIGVWYARSRELGSRRKVVLGSTTGGAVAAGLTVAPQVVNYLARMHQRRARGRTAYLTETVPTTVPEAVLFAPIGMAYFLFTPFPWMVTSAMDVVVALEALGNALFAVAGLWGLQVAWRRDRARTAALLVGLLAAGSVYGIGTANVGTAVRHRQMFVWVVYVFGAVGFTRWIGKRGLLKQ